MLFRDFSLHLQTIERVSARLEMTALLAKLFTDLIDQQATDRELMVALYLMQGSLVPSYQHFEFQMSEKMLLRTLARVVSEQVPSDQQSDGDVSLFAGIEGVTINDDEVLPKLQKEYKALGDIGELFEKTLNDLAIEPVQALSVEQVYDHLFGIAATSGVGSQDEKLRLLAALLTQLDSRSAKYVSRIVISKMRLGFSTMTIIDALSFVRNGSKADSATLEKAFFKKADLGKLALFYLVLHRDKSANELVTVYQAELGVPISPVLCQRLNSAVEIIDKMGQVLAEPKYDGLRVQIHFSRSGFSDTGLQYKAFTRNLEDVTHMFPELGGLTNALTVTDCIIDAEAIGIDPKSGGFMPFQATIQRKRKHAIAEKALEVPICFFAFDLMWLDGVSHLDTELLERKALLARSFEETSFLKLAPYELIEKPDVLKQFHEEQLALGLEGAVMKQPTSRYIAGRKSWRWVKIKEEEGSQGKLSDTIDCVVMGYYLGKGKRQQFGIGALLVGVRSQDEQGNRVVKSLSKIGTGLTDEQFRQVKQLADEQRAADNRKPVIYDVAKELTPDVWLEPHLVLEIAADEISQSPIHTAGVALRFPRLVRIREDKNLDGATSLSELGAIKIAT